MVWFATVLALGIQAYPFTISDDVYGPEPVVRLKVLKNLRTGENMSVCYSSGGGVEELYLGSKLRKVLTTRSRNSTAVRDNLSWGGRMLLPYANRIAGGRYTFNGSQHQLPINDVAGLNNSLHGLLWNKTLVVQSQHSTSEGAWVVLRYAFNGSDLGYPFLLDVTITYALTARGVQFTVAATNADAGGWPLPFYNGWHPYFLGNISSAKIVLDGCTTWAHVDVHQGPQYPPPRHSDMVPSTHVSAWQRDNGSDPIGGNGTFPTYMDDEVKALGPCHAYITKLVDVASGETIVLEGSPDFRFLQIYTGSKATGGEDAVVLEPLSAMSDAFNNHDGLHVISAGETYTNFFSVQVV